jgi:hypothetical protein
MEKKIAEIVEFLSVLKAVTQYRALRVHVKCLVFSFPEPVKCIFFVRQCNTPLGGFKPRHVK